jgi:uncharacterized protein (DUF1778 family)
MSTAAPKNQRLDVRLAADLKAILEEAAARTGQTLSDFVVSTLAEKAHAVNSQWRQLELSSRDWTVFQAALEDIDTEPNEALKQAAERYREDRGRTAE